MRTAVAVAAAVAAIALALLSWLAAEGSRVARLVRSDPTSTAFIEADRERGIDIRWHPLGYDEISDHLKLAVVVAEDISFFDHQGFDTHEMTAGWLER